MRIPREVKYYSGDLRIYLLLVGNKIPTRSYLSLVRSENPTSSYLSAFQLSEMEGI